MKFLGKSLIFGRICLENSFFRAPHQKRDSPKSPKIYWNKGTTRIGQPYLYVTTSLTTFMKVSIKDPNLEEQSYIESSFMMVIAPKSRSSNGFKTSTNIVSFPCLNSSFFFTANLIYCVKESIGNFTISEDIYNKVGFIGSLNVQTWNLATFFDLPRNSISHFSVTTGFIFSESTLSATPLFKGNLDFGVHSVLFLHKLADTTKSSIYVTFYYLS